MKTENNPIEEQLDQTPRHTINVPGDHVVRNCRDAYTADQADLVIWSFYRAINMTWQEAAGFYEMDTAVLNRVWRGKGTADELAAALQTFAAIKEATGKNAAPRYAQTSAARKIIHALDIGRDLVGRSKRDPGFIFIGADAGAGKSTCLQAWAEDNNHGLSCYMPNDRIGGTKHIVQELARLNNINTWISYNDMLPRVQRCMDRRILLVDDAHKLLEPATISLPKLEYFMGLHDTTNVVIVLAAALDKFGEMLSLTAYNAKQFWRRCAYHVLLTDPATRKDIEAVWRYMCPKLTLTNELATIFEAVNAHELGGFGKVSAIIKDAMRFADKRNEKLTAPLVLAVASEQLADLEKLGRIVGNSHGRVSNMKRHAHNMRSR